MRSVYYVILFLSTVLSVASLPAQQGPEVTDPDGLFHTARALVFEGKSQAGRDSLSRILQYFPHYTEVQVFLANSYRWEGAHGEARKHYNRITSRERSHEEVWVAAIENEIQAGNPSIALGLANKALLYLERSEAVGQLRQTLLQPDSAVVSPTEEGKERKFNSSFSVANRLETFDRFYEPMYYTYLEYQRNTKWGRIIPRFHYSNRFNTHAAQYELDLYPKLSKTFYGYVNYAFSDSELYPGHKAGLELYANLPKALEISAGARYFDFSQVNATLLTASFGMYRGNYYWSLRPYLTMVGSRGAAGSGSLLARRYLSDPFHFLGVNLAFGYIPELRQLQGGGVVVAENLLFLESQQLFMEYQFPSGSGQHLYKASLGVGRQEFLLEPGAFFWMVSGGFTYQLRL